MVSLIILIFVAIEHLIFGYVEMFGNRKMQSKAFGFEEQELNNSLLRSALANQGIYNIGFGLLVLFLVSIHVPKLVLVGTMGFVVLVGIYGAYTVSKKIMFVQALPAIFAIISLIIL